MLNTFGDEPGDVVANSQGDVVEGVTLGIYSSKADALLPARLRATVVTDQWGRWQYTDTALYSVWVRTPSGGVYVAYAPQAFTDVSVFVGPAGPAGPAGAASTVAGPTGPAGATGADSVVPGPTGPTGPSGGVASVNTRTGAVALTATDVGLANVNNTTDAGKPVSTLQAAADAAVQANVTAEAATARTNEANASFLTTGTLPDAQLSTAVARVQEAVNTVGASGSAQTIPPVTTATISRITLTASPCVLTFPALAAGASFTLVLVQNGTGTRLVTWPTSIMRWAGGVAPVLSTGANMIDFLTFTCVDGATWAGFVAGKDVR